MSAITDMLLLTSIDSADVDTDPNAPILAMNTWCRKHADGQEFKQITIARDATGGSKVFTTDVYACAGNYFPWEELIEALPSFGWDDYSAETTVLIVKNQDVERWIGVHADGRLIAPSLAANHHGQPLIVAQVPHPIDSSNMALLTFNGVYWCMVGARWKNTPEEATPLAPTGANYMLNLMRPAYPGIKTVPVKETKARR